MTCSVCVNKLTPAELGVGQGVKRRSAFHCGLLCTLESRDIRSTVWGPQRLSGSFHSWLASMQSASDENLDGASAKCSFDGTWHNVCPIFECGDKSKMDLFTAVRAALRLPWFFHAWTRVRLSVFVSTRQFNRDWAAAERVFRSGGPPRSPWVWSEDRDSSSRGVWNVHGHGQGLKPLRPRPSWKHPHRTSAPNHYGTF